jgi:hypothetical protein
MELPVVGGVPEPLRLRLRVHQPAMKGSLRCEWFKPARFKVSWVSSDRPAFSRSSHPGFRRQYRRGYLQWHLDTMSVAQDVQVDDFSGPRIPNAFIKLS